MNPKAASLIGSVLFMLAGQAGAGEPAPTEATVQQELAVLNRTMKELASLLEQQLHGQETSLLIKRVELSSRTLIAEQERLRKVRSEAAKLAEQEVSFARLLEAIEQEQSETAEAEGYEQSQVEQMELRLNSVKRRRQDMERELMVLENVVATAEADMEMLEAILDERLGLR